MFETRAPQPRVHISPISKTSSDSTGAKTGAYADFRQTIARLRHPSRPRRPPPAACSRRRPHTLTAAPSRNLSWPRPHDVPRRMPSTISTRCVPAPVVTATRCALSTTTRRRTARFRAPAPALLRPPARHGALAQIRRTRANIPGARPSCSHVARITRRPLRDQRSIAATVARKRRRNRIRLTSSDCHGDLPRDTAPQPKSTFTSQGPRD